jgi:hypothetical protein
MLRVRMARWTPVINLLVIGFNPYFPPSFWRMTQSASQSDSPSEIDRLTTSWKTSSRNST